MIGPLNTTAVREAVVSTLPQATREETAEAWAVVNAFCDEQWPPSVSQALVTRKLEKQRKERVEQARHLHMRDDLGSGP